MWDHSLSYVSSLRGAVEVESTGFIDAYSGKEYTRADARWGVSDPTVVSLEILTVLGAAPMCCYIIWQIINDDPARHYWIIVLSTAELYGGYVCCCKCLWR